MGSQLLLLPSWERRVRKHGGHAKAAVVSLEPKAASWRPCGVGPAFRHAAQLHGHLTENNSKMSEAENGSFSGLSLLERLLWSVLLQEALLVSVAHAATWGQVDVRDPCC